MVVPINTVGLIYDPDCRQGLRIFDSVCSYDFKLTGFAAFVLGPLVVMLLLAAGLAWVARGPSANSDA